MISICNSGPELLLLLYTPGKPDFRFYYVMCQKRCSRHRCSKDPRHKYWQILLPHLSVVRVLVTRCSLSIILFGLCALCVFVNMTAYKHLKLKEMEVIRQLLCHLPVLVRHRHLDLNLTSPRQAYAVE